MSIPYPISIYLPTTPISPPNHNLSIMIKMLRRKRNKFKIRKSDSIPIKLLGVRGTNFHPLCSGRNLVRLVGNPNARNL